MMRGFREIRKPESNIERNIKKNDKSEVQKLLDYKLNNLPSNLGRLIKDKEEREKNANKTESATLYDNMNYIDNYLIEAAITKKKQKILDNQDDLKKNFNKISSDLKKMVTSKFGKYDIKFEDDKFFRNHEDHKEQHYLLIYTLEPSNELSKSEVSKILSDIGNTVEKEFNSSKKEFLDKGLYFDNKKKDDTTRFVELHYDFY